MSQLTDCPSCGGLLPSGTRCCPHCHCKYPVMKRWRLVVATALGLSGAASCGSHEPVAAYGPGPVHIDLSVTVPVDASTPVDASSPHDSSTD
jgi:hypothetical protein